jgi:hypothetical protein
MASHKTPKENLLDVVRGKRVLILENDGGLDNGMEYVERLLEDNNTDLHVIYDLSDIFKNDGADYILKRIHESDIIIFMSQWVSDVSLELKKYAFGMQVKKTFIECYICDPTWYYQPPVVHDVYVLKPQRDDYFTDWYFYKLSDKAFWDYENEFDK